MRKDNLEKVRIERLVKLINELREVLNEICVSSEYIENSKERLIVSKCLDELIVEYMSNSKKGMGE